MFNKTNYFLQISFEWAAIFEALGLTETEKNSIKIKDDKLFSSPNSWDNRGIGIDDEVGNYEYYIFPDSVGNKSYRYSTIYDQQLKMFFETPNLNYGIIFSTPDNLETKCLISCLFSSEVKKDRAGFSIRLYREFSDNSKKPETKSIVSTFHKAYLNVKDAHDRQWESGGVKNEVYLIENIQDIDKKTVSKLGADTSINISISCQSIHDAQSSPIAYDFGKYEF